MYIAISRATTKEGLRRSITTLLRKKKKGNIYKAQLKIQKREKVWETKIGTKSTIRKTVMNMADANSPVPIITLSISGLIHQLNNQSGSKRYLNIKTCRLKVKRWRGG